MAPRRHVAVGISFVVFLILAYEALWAPNNFSAPDKIAIVSKGESFSHIADSLSARGVVSHPLLFKTVGKIFGYTHKMKVGKYSFKSGISNLEILRDLSGGFSMVNSSITLFEGMNGRQIAKLLCREVGIDSARFVSLLKDTSLIGIQGNESPTLEGYLLPDTYNFYWQDDEKEIIKRMTSEFKKFFSDSLQQRMKRMNVSLNEVLTMASIVEAEAMLDKERPIIAGVYYNRLRKRMRLEADPTVKYIIADGRRIYRSDLHIDHPYNTYMNYGLPPGPINNPGRKSIFAALYPAKHSYLYFVADGQTGGHRFAKSFSEHQNNVRLYRKARALAHQHNGNG